MLKEKFLSGWRFLSPVHKITGRLCHLYPIAPKDGTCTCRTALLPKGKLLFLEDKPLSDSLFV